MNNRIGFKLISLIVATAFLLQGCAYTFKVDTSLDELSRTPDRVEIARENRIEILTPSSVSVCYDVSMGQKVKYEKMEVKHQKRASVGEEIVFNIVLRPLGVLLSPVMVAVALLETLTSPLRKKDEKGFLETLICIFSPSSPSPLDLEGQSGWIQSNWGFLPLLIT